MQRRASNNFCFNVAHPDDAAEVGPLLVAERPTTGLHPQRATIGLVDPVLDRNSLAGSATSVVGDEVAIFFEDEVNHLLSHDRGLVPTSQRLHRRRNPRNFVLLIGEHNQV